MPVRPGQSRPAADFSDRGIIYQPQRDGGCVWPAAGSYQRRGAARTAGADCSFRDLHTSRPPHSSCSLTVHWPSTTLFPNGNYAVQCQVVGIPSGVITGVFVSNKTATTFQLTLQNGTSNGAVASTVSEIDCHGSY